MLSKMLEIATDKRVLMGAKVVLGVGGVVLACCEGLANKIDTKKSIHEEVNAVMTDQINDLVQAQIAEAMKTEMPPEV